MAAVTTATQWLSQIQERVLHWWQGATEQHQGYVLRSQLQSAVSSLQLALRDLGLQSNYKQKEPETFLEQIEAYMQYATRLIFPRFTPGEASAFCLGFAMACVLCLVVFAHSSRREVCKQIIDLKSHDRLLYEVKQELIKIQEFGRKTPDTLYERELFMSPSQMVDMGLLRETLLQQEIEREAMKIAAGSNDATIPSPRPLGVSRARSNPSKLSSNATNSTTSGSMNFREWVKKMDEMEDMTPMRELRNNHAANAGPYTPKSGYGSTEGSTVDLNLSDMKLRERFINGAGISHSEPRPYRVGRAVAGAALAEDEEDEISPGKGFESASASKYAVGA
eukprot:Clim_evm19s77 gene=Clim_evmTU19s77